MAVFQGGKLVPLPAGDTPVDAGNTGLTNGPQATTKTRVSTTANVADLAAGAPLVVDGQTLTAGDKVLVQFQSTATQNGIYSVTTPGSGSDGAWARDSGYNENTEINYLVIVQVIQGTLYGDTQWMLDSTGGLTIGTDAINFVKNSPNRYRETFTAEVFFDGQNQLTAAKIGTFNMLRAGYIVGASIKMDSARTAGTVTVQPHKNGTGLTPTDLDLTIDGTNTTKHRATVAYGTASFDFAAGDDIGAIVDSSSFTPLSNKGTLVLECEFPAI
jgi:hypothetical protein